MTADLTDSIARISSHTVSISLLAVSYSNYTLAISIPSNVVYATIDDRVFALCGAGAVGRAVPDTNYTRGITRGAVEAGRSETSDGSGRSMLSILSRSRGIVNRPEKDGLIRGVCYSFTLCIGG